MLEAFTIVSTGGLVLYQYCANPSLVGATDVAANARHALNDLIRTTLADPTNNTKSFHIIQGLTYVWKCQKDYYYIAMYPDILFEGPRQYLRGWAEQLVDTVMLQYAAYEATAKEEHQRNAAATAAAASSSSSTAVDTPYIRPDPENFHPVFTKLLNDSKTKTPQQKATPEQQQQQQSSTNGKSKKGGKEKRNWHDGNAKVTEKAMAELDMSSSSSSSPSTAAMSLQAQERALQEARQAYLPGKDEEEQESTTVPTNPDSWSSSIKGLLQQLSGNKVLTSSDLDKPLQQMQELLTSKNVASEIAQELCESCRQKLVGKRLNSLYRVQTAVQQALEVVLTKILNNDVDLLRNVMSKRGGGSDLSFFNKSKSGSGRAPYVIAVMGINGIGKTTTLAKLAYYFSKNGCKPLLVAGDTFRSGAVEQLKVHAACLEVPLFSQGYSKDPSLVAKAAIQHATEQGNDVVLIDTAGRMQNNVPLMKALGKLIQENNPDFVILVCEALVGHDGLSQYKMFRQAVGSSRKQQPIDGLILTKFDTVADKVGASLTLTHHTATPIVFYGTGQKYHHLKKISVEQVIQSLFR